MGATSSQGVLWKDRCGSTSGARLLHLSSRSSRPALVSSVTYLLNGQVDLTAAVLVALGAITGTVAGTHLLRRIPVPQLQWMFVVFILLVAARLLLIPPLQGGQVDLTLLVAAGYIGIGFAMGLSSGLFVIGGGIIAVPLMI